MGTDFEGLMADLTLREYRAGDCEAMYALDVRCFEPVFRFSRTAMRRFAEAKGAFTVVAESQGELAGFCIVQMEEHVGYVVTLDVATPGRRQGLARRLMAHVETQVRAAGGVDMALHVYAGNTAAVRFYESAGYARRGTAQDFYGRDLDALVYGKRLQD
jgi:[ribosomal protein S18]-alanine N-acetyltransferase